MENRNSQERKRKYNKESNGNLRTKKYHNQNEGHSNWAQRQNKHVIEKNQRMTKVTWHDNRKKYAEKNKWSLRDPWDDNKRCSIHIVLTAVPEWKEKEGGANNVLEEITVENVPNLVKKNEQESWGDTSQNHIKHIKAAAEHAAEACPSHRGAHRPDNSFRVSVDLPQVSS